LMAACAERVVAGIAAGELPGWRGAPALAAAGPALAPAARARLQARLYRIEGRDDEAKSLYEQALRLAPDDVDAARELGRLLLERGEADAARIPLARVWAKSGAAGDRLALAHALVL